MHRQDGRLELDFIMAHLLSYEFYFVHDSPYSGVTP